MNTQKKRLLSIGFYAPGTGLSRVMEEVLSAVQGDYQIDWLGIGYGEKKLDHGYCIHPTNPKGGDIFAAYQALEALQQEHYDVLLIVADIWQFRHYVNVLEAAKKNTRFVAYVPLDGNITDPELVKPLQKFDDVVVYTKWAAQQMQFGFDALGNEGNSADVIGHGVEVGDFNPLPDLLENNFDRAQRATLKKQVFANLSGPESSFIVLNPSRPADRKHVDLTIEAFAQFSMNKPENVKLCLHHAMRNEGSDAAVEDAIAKHNIADRIIWNPFGKDSGPISDAELNTLYQACDVGLNTSSGEGWGLVSFEHGATGAAQIVPNHSACTELWSGAAELTETQAPQIPDYSLLALSVPKLRSIVDALEALYQDPELFNHRSKQAYQLSTQKDFLWSTIRQQWREKLQ